MDKNIDYILKSHNNYEQMSKNAALLINEIIDKEINKKGYFTLVLSGGKTPKRLYSLFAEQNIAWENVMLFWGDERFVLHDHPESNFHMAYENLISKISIPDKNIYSIPTENVSPEKSAEIYEETLHSFFIDVNNSNNSFDCILLGIGEDGHTASLFPGNHALKENKRWVLDVTAPSNYSIRRRITLTLPIINRAKCIIFLVSGNSKRPILESMVNREKNKITYPAQLVRPKGDIYIFTDITL